MACHAAKVHAGTAANINVGRLDGMPLRMLHRSDNGARAIPLLIPPAGL
jgi:hypothetical protein